MGRRVRGRQRPDAGRPGGRRRGRVAAPRQLHRVLGRRRIAGGDRRRPGVGRASTASRNWRRRFRRAPSARWRFRAPPACRASTCRRCASRACRWSSRTGARWSRRPGLSPAQRQRLEQLVAAVVRSPKLGRPARRGIAGSTVIGRASDFERFVAAEEKRARERAGASSGRPGASRLVLAPRRRLSVGRVRGAAGVGGRLVADIARAGPTRRRRAAPAPSLRPLAWIGAGLAVNVLAVERLGIVLSSALLFWTRRAPSTARARGATRRAPRWSRGPRSSCSIARSACRCRRGLLSGVPVTGIAETLRALAAGFAQRADGAAPGLGARGHDVGHGDRRAARHRPGADGGRAAAGDVQRRADQRLHHVRRHLLRRHVRRLDHQHPAEHARRDRVDRHRHRRPRDGAAGPRRRGAGHRRHRLVRRGHAGHAAA